MTPADAAILVFAWIGATWTVCTVMDALWGPPRSRRGWDE
jgi:hypothetical protein